MQPDISVSQMKQSSINFTRWLVDNMRLDWNNILRRVEKITLTDEEDVVIWKFDKKGCFFVKSVYKFLTTNDAGIYYKKIWKGKIPAKIKIFLWLVANNALLTRDNMIKRKWTGDPSCLFCECNESVSHLLFQCSLAKAVWAVVAHCVGASNVPRNFNQCWAWCEQWLPYGNKFHAIGIVAICWAIWKTRNSACFEGKVVTSPIHVICYACSLIEYWAGLFLEEDKEQLIAGVNTMLKIAMQLVSKEVRTQKRLSLENKSTKKISRMDRSNQAVAGVRMLAGLLQETIPRKAVCRLLKLLCNQTWFLCWYFPYAVLASCSCRALSVCVVYVVSFYRAMPLSSFLYLPYKLFV